MVNGKVMTGSSKIALPPQGFEFNSREVLPRLNAERPCAFVKWFPDIRLSRSDIRLSRGM